MKPMISLLLFLSVCYLVGFIGSQANVQGMPVWYQTIQKPSWNPPGWLFAPVWTILYGMMGYAAWLVWMTPAGELPSGRRTRALVLFFAQLVLNGLWSWIFFGWHEIRIAFFEIVNLWFAILATMIMFFRVRPLAGWLLVPYLLWVTFATALNFAIWQMNS